MLKRRDSETHNFLKICFAFFFLSIASIVTEDDFQLCKNLLSLFRRFLSMESFMTEEDL
ncbi:hypothetical protein AtEden1_Chr2g0252161 [Arabidopsis thaliana]